ncbi:hypothetical protein CLAFUR0_20040, partial [Fulvia fulva]
MSSLLMPLLVIIPWLSRSGALVQHTASHVVQREAACARQACTHQSLLIPGGVGIDTAGVANANAN